MKPLCIASPGWTMMVTGGNSIIAAQVNMVGLPSLFAPMPGRCPNRLDGQAPVNRIDRSADA